MSDVPASAPRRSLVIVPTYNERDSVTRLIERLFEVAGDRVELLVIDDSSPDGTADEVERLATTLPGIHLLARGTKRGLGTAYVAGFRWALERDFPVIIEMDGDLSHDPAAVPDLLDRIAGADLVIGSRYVEGGGISNWSRFRRALSRAGNLYARWALDIDVQDATSGFRAYRAAVLSAQDLGTVRSEGYAFQIEMTRRIHRSGGRIVECPIHFDERTSGRSKLSRRIVIEALLRVTLWAIQDRLSSQASSRGGGGSDALPTAAPRGPKP